MIRTRSRVAPVRLNPDAKGRPEVTKVQTIAYSQSPRVAAAFLVGQRKQRWMSFQAGHHMQTAGPVVGLEG
jgi:hypothetical protein